jgi:hypothetical protein
MPKTSLLSKKYIWGEDISIIKVRLITKEIIKTLGFFFVNSKNDYCTKLSSKIASESRGSKQYWNIIKSLMNYDSTDSRFIPPYK